MSWSFWDDYNERNANDCNFYDCENVTHGQHCYTTEVSSYGDPYKPESPKPTEHTGKKCYLQIKVFGTTYYL